MGAKIQLVQIINTKCRAVIFQSCQNTVAPFLLMFPSLKWKILEVVIETRNSKM